MDDWQCGRFACTLLDFLMTKTQTMSV